MDTINECNEEENTCAVISPSNFDEIIEISNKTQTKPQKKQEIEKKVTITTTRLNNQPKKTIDILKQVKKCISEWLTLEALIYIHGENRVKEVLNENKLSDYFDSLKIVELQICQQMKYLDICKKLNFKEMADEKFDRAVRSRTLNPVPDYKELKMENQNLDVKVKSFYNGELYEQNDKNFSTRDAATESGSSMILPQINTNVQRQKIFLTTANKV